MIATRVHNATLNIVDFPRESEPFQLPPLGILMRKCAIENVNRIVMRQPMGKELDTRVVLFRGLARFRFGRVPRQLRILV